MVKNEAVSLKRQTIYCLIPFLDIYAAFRVKRIRKYFLIMLPIGFAVGIVDTTLFPEDSWRDFEDVVNSFLFLYYIEDANDPSRMAVHVAEHVGFVLIAIYLIRYWSKKWNQKFISNS